MRVTKELVFGFVLFNALFAVFWITSLQLSILNQKENNHLSYSTQIQQRQCNFDTNDVVTFGSFNGTLYYYKQGYSSSNTTLSIATMCTMDRFLSAKQMMINFNGPISIAIYIVSLENETKNKTVCNEIKNTFDVIKNKYDIYISILYPITSYVYNFYKTAVPPNALRNLAVSHINTNYVICIDVDLMYISNTINFINDMNDEIFNVSAADKSENKIWIIPAFQWISEEFDIKYKNDNRYSFNKTELLQLIDLKYIIPFHYLYSKAQDTITPTPGHICTNYDKWYNTTKQYTINYCNMNYEPWMIIKTNYVQNKYKWDNDFVGRGCDKVQQITYMSYNCIEFEVLNNVFIIHEYTANKPKYDNLQQFNTQKYWKQFQIYCSDPNQICWDNSVCIQFYKQTHLKKFPKLNTISNTFMDHLNDYGLKLSYTNSIISKPNSILSHFQHPSYRLHYASHIFEDLLCEGHGLGNILNLYWGGRAIAYWLKYDFQWNVCETFNNYSKYSDKHTYFSSFLPKHKYL
eukprot:356214_1